MLMSMTQLVLKNVLGTLTSDPITMKHNLKMNPF